MSTHGLPEVEYPMRLNAAEELLDSHIAQGHGSNPCLRTGNFTWTYQQVLDHANRMANLLVKWGLAPGERVYYATRILPCWSQAGLPSSKPEALL